MWKGGNVKSLFLENYYVLTVLYRLVKNLSKYGERTSSYVGNVLSLRYCYNRYYDANLLSAAVTRQVLE